MVLLTRVWTPWEYWSIPITPINSRVVWPQRGAVLEDKRGNFQTSICTSFPPSLGHRGLKSALSGLFRPTKPSKSQSVFLGLKNHQPQLIIENNGISENVLVLLSCSFQISQQTSLYPLHPLTHEAYEQLLVRNKRQTTVHSFSTPFFQFPFSTNLQPNQYETLRRDTVNLIRILQLYSYLEKTSWMSFFSGAWIGVL